MKLLRGREAAEGNCQRQLGRHGVCHLFILMTKVTDTTLVTDVIFHGVTSLYFAQRKPMVAARWSGTAPLRVAARRIDGLLLHDPPRTLL